MVTFKRLSDNLEKYESDKLDAAVDEYCRVSRVEIEEFLEDLRLKREKEAVVARKQAQEVRLTWDTVLLFIFIIGMAIHAVMYSYNLEM